MNPFIFLQKTPDATEGTNYMVNVEHIIKVDTVAGAGCKILTTSGEFYCSESFDDVCAKIKQVFDK
ncbi:hypothetical protein [Spirosoma gilvum]